MIKFWYCFKLILPVTICNFVCLQILNYRLFVLSYINFLLIYLDFSSQLSYSININIILHMYSILQSNTILFGHLIICSYLNDLMSTYYQSRKDQKENLRRITLQQYFCLQDNIVSNSLIIFLNLINYSFMVPSRKSGSSGYYYVVANLKCIGRFKMFYQQ